MKKLLMIALSAAALTACQQPAGDNAGVDKLQSDVDTMKLDLYGAKVATCADDKILANTDAYQASLEGLPSADIKGEAWHTANGERDGVMTTPSGLQYTIVQPGQKDGKTPALTDTIKVNYHGIFPNGEKFDSSYDRGEPIEFKANGVIAGWIEGLGGMAACEARTLYVPFNLAYGPKGRGGIPPNATLLFHVQLLGIEKKGLIKK